MKWSREIKVGILSLVVIVVLIWGYEFLKGKNVFGHSNTYNIIYNHVDQLTASSPVMVRGFKVGMVTKITLNPEDVSELIVEVEVDGAIKLPPDTKAILYSVGIVGGKGVILEFDSNCDDDCIPNGGFLKGESRGLLTSMVPESEIDLYINKLQTGLDGLIDSLGFEDDSAASNSMSSQFQDIISNLASITQRLDLLIAKSDEGIAKSIADLQGFTGSLEKNEVHLSNVMSNLDSISSQLAKADIDQTFEKVDNTVKELQSVVKTADNSFKNIDKIIDQVENGEGTLGKLVGNDSLYQEVQLTIEHMNLLLQDLRLNPKRYVNISVIGRKNDDYEKPENDPAFSK
jgi:phospholipid/cholesterol/gamma-HCH transport system substrate-binding protein